MRQAKWAQYLILLSTENDRKNAAIYVGRVDGKAVPPSQVFTENQAARTIELAKFALESEEKIRVMVGPFLSRTPGPIIGRLNLIS